MWSFRKAVINNADLSSPVIPALTPNKSVPVTICQKLSKYIKINVSNNDLKNKITFVRSLKTHCDRAKAKTGKRIHGIDLLKAISGYLANSDIKTK